MLALEIIKSEHDINLKGLAIGNGWFDSILQGSTMFEYAYYHGYVDHERWMLETKLNCNCSENGQQCNFFNRMDLVFFRNGVNPYNVHDNMCSLVKYNYTGHPIIIGNGRNFKNCSPDVLKMYMNLDETRRALNIPDHVNQWNGLSVDAFYIYEESADVKDMAPIIKQIIDTKKLKNIIVYNGDLDLICDFIGNQRFVHELGYPVKDKYRVWKINELPCGFVKRYDGITFVKVNNAGHSVPMDRPDAGLAILKELIGISKL